MNTYKHEIRLKHFNAAKLREAQNVAENGNLFHYLAAEPDQSMYIQPAENVRTELVDDCLLIVCNTFHDYSVEAYDKAIKFHKFELVAYVIENDDVKSIMAYYSEDQKLAAVIFGPVIDEAEIANSDNSEKLAVAA